MTGAVVAGVEETGHTVVEIAIVDVVTCPTGQLVIVGAHEVIVYTLVE